MRVAEFFQYQIREIFPPVLVDSALVVRNQAPSLMFKKLIKLAGNTLKQPNLLLLRGLTCIVEYLFFHSASLEWLDSDALAILLSLL